tara:strand:+ start:138082 stop:139506 length:1425 start_codon:yes stop_codon:yes gene_type:complete
MSSKQINLPLFFLLILCTTASLFASTQSDATGEQNLAEPIVQGEAAQSKLISNERIVEVDETISDQQISDRLMRILVTTKRFNGPGVEVQYGVVYLSGFTKDASDFEWAAELASNTEGVVAVVNNIQIERSRIWTLEPAANEIRNLWSQFVQALPLLLLGLFVLAGTILVAHLSKRATNRRLEEHIQSHLLRNVIQKLLYLAIILLGIYLFLRISGLTRIAVTLAGGTGLVGLVAGFAFRDIAENFLASILISVQRPFQIGDTIEVDGHTGIVQKVTSRGTVLMDFDGDHIQITNSTIYKSTIRNLTANPKVRIGFAIGVGYDSSVTQAQEITLQVLRDHPAVLDTPDPVVLLEELGASTINMRVYFWIDGHEHSMLKVRSSLMRLIIREFEAAGISLPDESREVIFPHGVPVRILNEAESESPIHTPPSPRPSDDQVELPGTVEDLRSEAADIQQQADDSRTPEEGEGIMASS